MRHAGRALLVVVMLFLVGPFILICLTGLSGGETLAFPPDGLSLRWVIRVFEIESFRDSFALSLTLGIGATLIALILGIPAAYALVRYDVPGADAIRNLLTAPIIVPGIIVGLALLRHLVIPSGLGVTLALFLGHTALLIPYAVRVTAASLQNLRADIEDAAILLGASRIGAFVRVTLPNIKNGIMAAFIIGFITSFNEVPVSLFLTGPGVATLPVDMLLYMEYNYDPSIAALSGLLALMSLGVVLTAERLLGLSRYV
ncbi:Inner membrane ABC transporter permease protein YdcV [Roseivivax jejudonensis]|uniref:Inner membrane ABC transporter permease protein YdcV n=1 Tax=Roseivivax jejudonensis TaxID=1529041 RepID=A0A1X7A5J2_9RHOB|nr:ABC transporter permease [Roseivivax jejudonensis]SLN70739.1 Inner membrane ABC transporter permease protein YdcV [Roseivivax jejudonensis]